MPQSQQHHNGLQRWLKRHREDFRHRLAHTDALPQLAILGTISGLITGLVAVLFRLSFELPLQGLLDGNNANSFAELSSYIHFLLPLGELCWWALFSIL